MDEYVDLLGQRVRLVDLSHRLEPTSSEPLAPVVQRQSHDEGAELWQALYGIPPAALPDGRGFAGEILNRVSTHAGTHVDAPWHYGPEAAGEPAATRRRQRPLLCCGVVCDRWVAPPSRAGGTCSGVEQSRSGGRA